MATTFGDLFFNAAAAGLVFFFPFFRTRTERAVRSGERQSSSGAPVTVSSSSGELAKFILANVTASPT